MLRARASSCIAAISAKNVNSSGVRRFSDDKSPYVNRSQDQASSFTAKDVEFSPNRAKDVMQNYVAESSKACSGDEPIADSKKFLPPDSPDDKEHLSAYQSGNKVSLYSVMQSNVPEPFSTKDRSPSNLNMPGGSSSKDSKYLSSQMQSTHQSKQ